MIERWEDRLAAMDHSHGTSDKMRKAAMLAEIKDLRAAVASPQHAVGVMALAHRREVAALNRALTDERRRTKSAQASAAKWRSHFNDLRKLLLEVKTK